MFKKKYKYLVCYGFSRKVGDKLQYTEGGTGRTIIDFHKKIKTQKDIYDVENILRGMVEINNISQLGLYSFGLLGK